jgi:hypothetical protein
MRSLKLYQANVACSAASKSRRRGERKRVDLQRIVPAGVSTADAARHMWPRERRNQPQLDEGERSFCGEAHPSYQSRLQTKTTLFRCAITTHHVALTIPDDFLYPRRQSAYPWRHAWTQDDLSAPCRNDLINHGLGDIFGF